MKILIVDDNADYRQLLVETFSEKGWDVVDARDGAAGMAALWEHTPDVVLSDILMPHMDGFSFLKEVRNSEFGNIVFIFYTSAYEKKTQEEFAFSLGVDAYIVKPLDPEEIYSVLWELLKGTKPRPAAHGLPSEEEFLRKHNVVLAESLYEKVQDLRTESEQRRRAEAELDRLKRQVEGRPLPSDIAGVADCPFVVSEDFYAPMNAIDTTCKTLLDKGLPVKAAEAVEKICMLTGRMRGVLDGLIKMSDIVSREDVLAPAQEMLALIGSGTCGDDPTLRTGVKNIEEELNNFIGYVDDLLRAGIACRQPIEKTSVDVSEIAREIEHDLRLGAPHREVRFLIREDIEAIADRQMVRLALGELIDNAWKFSSKKEFATIEFGKTTIAGRSVLFVRDDGVGFDMSCADALFTAFRRLHPKEEFSGNGIGLVIVKAVVVRHGGTVWAVGEPGAGATFYFTLDKM